jgi:hypothetical protein
MTDREKTLNSYVTDMLSLEEHILQAIQAQVSDFADEYPEVAAHLRRVESVAEEHVAALKELDRTEQGSAIGEAAKRAGAMVAGLGAAAVDLVRTEKLPKNLRDDYTAGSLAYVGYVMLLTTARAFDAEEVAEVAEEHMADWAQINMALGDLIPGAVLAHFRSEKLPVGSVSPAEVNESVRRVWEEVS